MANKHTPSYKTPEELLKTNPKVSRPVVQQYAELKKQLEKLGVDTTSHYMLSSPWRAISNLKKDTRK